MNRRRFLSTLGATTVATLHSDAVEKLEAANRFASQRSPNALARDEDYWFRVQHAFTIDRGNINLNNGSVCPSPRVVQEAMNQYLTIMNMSPSYYVMSFWGLTSTWSVGVLQQLSVATQKNLQLCVIRLRPWRSSSSDYHFNPAMKC